MYCRRRSFGSGVNGASFPRSLSWAWPRSRSRSFPLSLELRASWLPRCARSRLREKRDALSLLDATDDADDEFFDAIETGNLPNLHVEKQLLSPTENDTPVDTRILDEPSVEAYKHLRKKLPIGKDDRPSVSLWAILKNNIGKDLTKISFPVSFNEPTSMLQRMAEDMEFSECLDVAAKCPDSTKRIAYVGAFAMSNYSSTIGRIAKPFNPMLASVS